LSSVPVDLIPSNEAQRLKAVKRYDILDTPPDGSFDRITALATRRFNVPIAIISIVDHDRIWFKSHHGLDVSQIGRDAGLCASAILSPDAHILRDARMDPRSLTNPLVAGEFGLRFYAGVPLQTSDGYNLGTLCVIDKVPRPIDQGQIDDLKDLASVVMDQMELRLAARQAAATAKILAQEIDHRVMNSLQFVSSLLQMQSRETDLAVSASQHLIMAANRVMAVAQVHRNFYADAVSDVSCIDFVRRLCADLSQIVGKDIFVHGDEGTVPSTQIQSIGLIINELVTNAAKHGMGRIDVSYRIESSVQEICVCDDGKGLPVGFDLTQSVKGLGMRVVSILAAQLGGQITVNPSPTGRGACFMVTFPA
jgi:two-component sensor histidine kinase